MNGEDLAVANAVVVYTGIGPQLSMTEKVESLWLFTGQAKRPVRSSAGRLCQRFDCVRNPGCLYFLQDAL
jgi:hypothetical protein